MLPRSPRAACGQLPAGAAGGSACQSVAHCCSVVCSGDGGLVIFIVTTRTRWGFLQFTGQLL